MVGLSNSKLTIIYVLSFYSDSDTTRLLLCWRNKKSAFRHEISGETFMITLQGIFHIKINVSDWAYQ